MSEIAFFNLTDNQFYLPKKPDTLTTNSIISFREGLQYTISLFVGSYFWKNKNIPCYIREVSSSSLSIYDKACNEIKLLELLQSSKNCAKCLGFYLESDRKYALISKQYSSPSQLNVTEAIFIDWMSQIIDFIVELNDYGYYHGNLNLHSIGINKKNIIKIGNYFHSEKIINLVWTILKLLLIY